MSRKLIIEGNAIYEIDEECMLKKRLEEEEREKLKRSGENKNSQEEKQM